MRARSKACLNKRKAQAVYQLSDLIGSQLATLKSRATQCDAMKDFVSDLVIHVLRAAGIQHFAAEGQRIRPGYLSHGVRPRCIFIEQALSLGKGICNSALLLPATQGRRACKASTCPDLPDIGLITSPSGDHRRHASFSESSRCLGQAT